MWWEGEASVFGLSMKSNPVRSLRASNPLLFSWLTPGSSPQSSRDDREPLKVQSVQLMSHNALSPLTQKTAEKNGEMKIIFIGDWVASCWLEFPYELGWDISSCGFRMRLCEGQRTQTLCSGSCCGKCRHHYVRLWFFPVMKLALAWGPGLVSFNSLSQDSEISSSLCGDCGEGGGGKDTRSLAMISHYIRIESSGHTAWGLYPMFKSVPKAWGSA